MKIQKGIQWTPAQWYNSPTYKVSYKRNYKAASSSIVSLIGEHQQETKPAYNKRFSVLRNPYDRAVSMYKHIKYTLNRIQDKTFSEYLEYTLKEGYFDKHQFPQTFWIVGIPELTLFTLKQIEQVREFIGTSMPVPHLNRIDKSIHLTNRDREIIETLYSDDIDLYQRVNK